MLDYKGFKEKYVDGLEWLGDAGDHAYYRSGNEVVEILSESSNRWQNSKPKYYYGEQAKDIAAVFDKDYEYEDDFWDALNFAKGE